MVRRDIVGWLDVRQLSRHPEAWTFLYSEGSDHVFQVIIPYANVNTCNIGFSLFIECLRLENI
jgi:hypothetical protein